MATSKFITAAILAASLTSPVHALDGTALKDSCNGSQPNLCLGYVAGVLDETAQAFCRPDKVRYNQLEAIFTKYLNDHPEKLHLPASVLVIDAVHEAFPCDKEGK